MAKCPTCHQELKDVGLSVDTDLKTVVFEENRVKLSKQQIKIVDFMLQNAKRMVTKEELRTLIYGNEPVATSGKVLDVQMHRIRARLVPLGIGVETVHGLGYRITVL